MNIIKIAPQHKKTSLCLLLTERISSRAATNIDNQYVNTHDIDRREEIIKQLRKTFILKFNIIG